MAKQFYTASYIVHEQDVRTQAVYEHGKRRVELDFESEPDKAQGQANSNRRNVLIRTAYSDIKLLELHPVKKEFKAEFSVIGGFFKGGAWHTPADKIKYSFSANNSEEVKELIDEYQRKLFRDAKTIPLNTSVTLDSLIETQRAA